MAFGNTTPPDWYTSAGEPKSQTGINKGLMVVLDAHNHLLSEGSVDSDYEGFIGLVGNRESFPQSYDHGFNIRPGHQNVVALTVTKITAQPSIRAVKPEKRNCRFPDETDILKMHNVYTQSNCLLECYLFHGQVRLAADTNVTYNCTPWFLPFQV